MKSFARLLLPAVSFSVCLCASGCFLIAKTIIPPKQEIAVPNLEGVFHGPNVSTIAFGEEYFYIRKIAGGNRYRHFTCGKNLSDCSKKEQPLFTYSMAALADGYNLVQAGPTQNGAYFLFIGKVDNAGLRAFLIPATVPKSKWEILQQLARRQQVQIEISQFGIGLVGTFEHIRNFANAILKRQKADPFLDEINWRRTDAEPPADN